MDQQHQADSKISRRCEPGGQDRIVTADRVPDERVLEVFFACAKRCGAVSSMGRQWGRMEA
jgi:hypothetical protein